MSDSTLTEKQATELLRRLATDDAFRGLFESKPAKALVEMGVPHETVVNLNAACLCASKLADKATFQHAVDTMDAQTLTATSKMVPPKISVPR